jgi:hypothetical protein
MANELTHSCKIMTVLMLQQLKRVIKLSTRVQAHNRTPSMLGGMAGMAGEADST